MALISGYSQVIPAVAYRLFAILGISLHIISFLLLVRLKASKGDMLSSIRNDMRHIPLRQAPFLSSFQFFLSGLSRTIIFSDHLNQEVQETIFDENEKPGKLTGDRVGLLSATSELSKRV